MGELLLDEETGVVDGAWSVERRFRVTEVFLAVLWVCSHDLSYIAVGNAGFVSNFIAWEKG